ncbi:MAG: aminotransferase class V-fold PLP-dependent enzyme [Elusimicrobiota bacterium]
MRTSKAERALDVEAVRAEFPALAEPADGRRLVYLDNACTALKSRRVAERLRGFYLSAAGCGGRRSTHRVSRRAEEVFQDARAVIARFINAEKPEEIVFTSGTTGAVNLLARAYPYEAARREVVVTEMEHNSVLLPFHEAARRGEAVLRVCPLRDGILDEEALERLVCGRTALVAVTHSSNVLGCKVPVERVARLAHSRGARVFVDDAQYLSSHREDVRSTDADFAAFSSHKLGGPFGIGVLYGKEHLLNGLRGSGAGGGTVRDIAASGDGLSASYLDPPARFEAGVQDFGGAAGFAEAVRLLESWPAAAVRAHAAGLVRRVVEGLSRHEEVSVLGDPRGLAEGSIVSFRSAHPAFSLSDFGLYLDSEVPGLCVAVRVGEHCAHLLHKRLGIPATARVSLFAYNTAEEVDLFLGCLESYLKEIRA